LTLISWIKDAVFQAKVLLPDQKRIRSLLEAAVKIAPRLPVVSSTELRTIIRLIKAWLKRDYTHLPTNTLLWALAALIYFVNPGDILPDPIPGGLIDDAVVLAWVVRSIQGELEGFTRWEAENRETGIDGNIESGMDQPPMPSVQ